MNATDSRPQLRWNGLRTPSPVAMAPVWAKANLNTTYFINRIDSVEGGLGGWKLRARRQDGTKVELGGFLRRKDAIEAANRDCGLV